VGALLSIVPPADRLQQDFRENVLQREGVLIIVTIIIDGSEAILYFSGNSPICRFRA